jgi:peptidyl-prolyl cis-trans isomerase B (cyclophilin B)
MYTCVRWLLSSALALTGVAALAAGKVVPEFPTVLGFNGVGMVPIPPIAELAHATVTSKGNSVTVQLGQRTITYTLDQTDAIQQDAKIKLLAAPFKYADITYVPLRSLVTALGGSLANGAATPFTLNVMLPGNAKMTASLVNQTGEPQDLHKTNTELFLVKTDGSTAQQLTYGVADNSNVLFSNDGGSIIYNHLYERATERATERVTDIFSRNPYTPSASNLTASFSKNHTMSGFATMSNSGTLWFLQLDTSKMNTPNTLPNLCHMYADGSAYQQMNKGSYPLVSANGKIVAYATADKVDPKKNSTHVMNADGSNDHAVATARLLALSPDGNEVVCIQTGTAPTQIYTLSAFNTVTGKEIFSEQKDAKFNEVSPVFTPDSKQIVYVQRGNGVWIMNADRSNSRQLDKDQMDSQVKISANGAKIAFTRHLNLFVMNADGSHLIPLDPQILVRDFAISADGARIAVAGITVAGRMALMPRTQPQPAKSGKITPPVVNPVPTSKTASTTPSAISHGADAADTHHTTPLTTPTAPVPPVPAPPQVNKGAQPPTQAEIDAAKAAGVQQATIKTAKGNIVIELDGGDAPLTVANFVKLTKAGFYNGLTFHRVVPGFVAQGGDPNGDGSGGPGYSIKLEIAPKLKHIEGALAMARTNEPDSAGSQFYITLAATSFLDGQYAVFGKVISGMDVVKKIAIGDKIDSIVMK